MEKSKSYFSYRRIMTNGLQVGNGLVTQPLIHLIRPLNLNKIMSNACNSPVLSLAMLTQPFGRAKSSQPVCLIRDPLKVSRKQNEVVIIGDGEAFGQIGAG